MLLAGHLPSALLFRRTVYGRLVKVAMGRFVAFQFASSGFG
jgi:hypothetical protein